jgi:mannose-6-phosphate isomerase-like protein (cupin superfamily)
MERLAGSGLEKIAAGEYGPHFAGLQHVFLVGNLQLPCPHPFFRDPRLEIIACRYEPGDHGAWHWHPDVTEYEYVLEGSMVYQDAFTGEVQCFRTGDLRTVPAGVCVRRSVEEPCRTLAVKVPSSDRKIHCCDCTRTCTQRVEPFRENA